MRRAANSTDSSANRRAEHASYPQISQTRLKKRRTHRSNHQRGFGCCEEKGIAMAETRRSWVARLVATLETTLSRSATRTCCNILSRWNTPSVAPIAGKRFRWFSTCRFAAKATSRTVKCAATQSKSVTAYRTTRSLASTPRLSNRPL